MLNLWHLHFKLSYPTLLTQRKEYIFTFQAPQRCFLILEQKVLYRGNSPSTEIISKAKGMKSHTVLVFTSRLKKNPSNSYKTISFHAAFIRTNLPRKTVEVIEVWTTILKDMNI